MKNYKLILFAFSILGLITTSCNPSVEAPGAEDQSEVTFLPKIILEGDTSIELDCDASSYSDPGAVAEVAGQEIELNTAVAGTYYGGSSVDGVDIYSVSYSAFNDDGIPATAFRKITWPPCSGDFVTSIAGVYTCAMTRTPGYSTEDIGPILIKDLGDNVFAISDAIGGWYEHEYGYGPDYAALGMTVTANNIATNDFTYDDVIGVGAFGGSLNMTSFSVDPATKTITYSVSWTFGYVWDIVLTQM
ncbi:hypothetical protein PK35_16900 [Tamlana nanhaiensis]|uniref:BT-2262-like C-terminal domain-containing protein n=1 Tax=Neotamlana nanhaiensis TaxID=1382798 RepID=A0A0D7VW32_9FLAO|nr:BT_2262 family domain-containing protein [Tamlana nanhaiensis]KJD31004.1 hypothetical protein PK35_16900 [Tamlana nanhaiensis]